MEFLKIPLEGNWYYPENTNRIIVNFLRIHLNLYITESDISISHRQSIPREKEKYGRNYIPPIYCKFLNRHLVHEIMRRRHRLDNTRNKFNQKYEIRENLTKEKRLLLASVESKLKDFRFKWVKNGKIFVRKNSGHKAIRIFSKDTLEELLKKPHTPKEKLPATSKPTRSLKSNSTELSSVKNPSYASAANSSSRVCSSEALFQFKNKSFVDYRSPS